MIFKVHELPKAIGDKEHFFCWICERSPAGADAWLAAYDDATEKLKLDAGSFSVAYENDDLDDDVKQILFKTRRGRIYRALFLIENEDVYILRIRGPGQDSITQDDFA